MECIKKVLNILKKKKKKKNIHVDFVATDGDRQYDSLHEEFFEVIFNLFKSNMSFTQIFDNISNSKNLEKPISDFLHLLKMLRSNLVKCGLAVDNKNIISLKKDQLLDYNMGKALIDLSSHVKMKDHYHLEIFPSKNILKAIDENNWSFIFTQFLLT